MQSVAYPDKLVRTPSPDGKRTGEFSDAADQTRPLQWL
jgi:hypothetical protein